MEGCHSITSMFGASHPVEGDSVKVYYDPSDESNSMLASQSFVLGHKPYILLALIAVIVLILMSVELEYHFRNEKSLQMIMGAVEGITLAQKVI